MAFSLFFLPMFFSYVRHRVKDFSTWRKAFDDSKHLANAKGKHDVWVIQVEGNPNDVVVITTWDHKEDWDRFLASHDPLEMKEAMEKGGVLGTPENVTGEIL